MFKQFITLISAIILAAVPISASHRQSAYPNWKLHSSFDNRPRRVIDTPEKVYFFVHQRPFDTGSTFLRFFENNSPAYGQPTGAIFIHDKSNPGEHLVDLHQIASLSGTDIRALEVEPKSGVIAIGYSDGGVDIVTPKTDGSYNVDYFTEIKSRNFPGDALISNISFDADGEHVRVSCGNGFVEYSVSDRRATASSSWGKPVVDITRTGSRNAAIIDNTVKISAPDASMRKLSEFVNVDAVNTLLTGSPKRLLPFSDNYFAVVSDAGEIILAAYDGAKWTATSLVKDAAMLLGTTAYVCNRVEQTVTRTANGYYIGTPSKAYHLSAEGNSKPALTSVNLPSGSTLYSSSYNLSGFWFYRNRRNLQSASYVSGKWSDLSVPLNISAPLSCGEALFDYSSTQGLVSSNAQGCYDDMIISLLNGNVAKNIIRQPALVTTYKDGVWRNVAQVYNAPAEAATNSQLKSDYTTMCNNNQFPVADPVSLYVDPLFPDYIHLGSLYSGAATSNIKDPSEMPLLTMPSNYAISQHGFAFDKFTELNGGERFGIMAGFDADNTLWLYRVDPWGSRPSQTDQHPAYFYYLTEQDRREIFEQGNPNKLKWRRFTGIVNSWGNASIRAWVAKHPKNKNLIFSTYEEYSIGRHLGVYDHKGTLDNTSDDTYRRILAVSTPEGNEQYLDFINDVLEDPVTGELYVFSNQTIAVIDLDNPISDDGKYMIKGRLLGSDDAKGATGAFNGSLAPSDACFDEYGRLWIALQRNGVIGYDCRTRSIFAHYTPENSPLPSYYAKAVGWNPDTQSLFISTNDGIAEVKPDAPDAVHGDLPTFQRPFANPTNVSADYTGTIAVRNVPDAVNLSICDMDDNIIATLPAAVSGVTYWNLLTDDGRRATPGLYKIVDKAGYSAFPEIKVTVK